MGWHVSWRRRYLCFFDLSQIWGSQNPLRRWIGLCQYNLIKPMNKLLRTDRAATTILIRLMVGAVFLSEGIQKFLFPAVRGAGRFKKIGLPEPEFLGYFVGSFEVVCGLLLLLGLFTRLAAIPLLIIMLVAMATTKADVLVNDGLWAMAHGSRTDWSMLLGSMFLLLKGGGRWSADLALQKGAGREGR